MRRAAHGLEAAALLLESHIQHGIQSRTGRRQRTDFPPHTLLDLREASSPRNTFFNLIGGLRLLDAADFEALGDLRGATPVSRAVYVSSRDLARNALKIKNETTHGLV